MEEFQRPIVLLINLSKAGDMQKGLGFCHMEIVPKCVFFIRFIKYWVVSNT